MRSFFAYISNTDEEIPFEFNVVEESENAENTKEIEKFLHEVDLSEE